METVRISEIELTNKTLEDAAQLLQRTIEKSDQKIEIVVETYQGPGTRYADSISIRKRTIPNLITLKLKDVPINAVCELISSLSNSFYRVTPNRITFYKPETTPAWETIKSEPSVPANPLQH